MTKRARQRPQASGILRRKSSCFSVDPLNVSPEDEEGGRRTPFFAGYRPQLFFRTADVRADVELPAGLEMVMPGDTAELRFRLEKPVALAENPRFAPREGGRTVGRGVVIRVLAQVRRRGRTASPAVFL